MVCLYLHIYLPRLVFNRYSFFDIPLLSKKYRVASNLFTHLVATCVTNTRLERTSTLIYFHFFADLSRREILKMQATSRARVRSLRSMFAKIKLRPSRIYREQLEEWQKTLSNLAIWCDFNKSNAKCYKNSITVPPVTMLKPYTLPSELWFMDSTMGVTTRARYLARRVKQIPFGILHLLFHVIYTHGHRDVDPDYSPPTHVLPLRTQKITSNEYMYTCSFRTSLAV